eukprot:1663270-Prymnesium_polylepis.1
MLEQVVGVSAATTVAAPAHVGRALGVAEVGSGGCGRRLARIALHTCGNGVVEVPAHRWKLKVTDVRMLSMVQQQCVRHGGFIVGEQKLRNLAAGAVLAEPRKTLGRAFLWRGALHPFVQRRLSSSDGSIVFRSPAAGAIHCVVADHVVRAQ